MTKDECAIVSAYTGISMLQGADLGYLYRYLSKFIGRPAYTHELPAIAECYKEEIKEDFLTLCRNAVDTQLNGGEPDAG